MVRFFDVEKLNKLSDVKFYFGDIKSGLAEISEKVALMGKIAFITFSDTHERYAKTVISSIFAANAKLISLIMPEGVKYTVEYTSLVFNLPEDIRAVIVVDRKLFRIASYYAAVKGVPLIYVPDSACAGDVLERKFYLKNGEKYDSVAGAKDVYVIVDENTVKKEVAEAFAFNMARIITLIDYRIAVAKFAKTDASAYCAALEGLKSTYAILSEKSEDRPLFALYNGLKIALADRAETFSFINSSSERVAACLFAGGVNVSPQAELYYAIRILKLYAAAFCVEEEGEFFPTYLNRAEKAAAALGLSQSAEDGALLDNIAFARKNLSAAIKVMNSLQAEVKSLLSHESGILGKFYALGGKAENIDGEFIRLAGDTVFGVNTMSFLRETGITD